MVAGDARAQLGFSTYATAVAEAQKMARAHRDRGGICELVVQDDSGRLVTLTVDAERAPPAAGPYRRLCRPKPRLKP